MSASVQRGAAKLAQRARKGLKLKTNASAKQLIRRGLSSELLDEEYGYHHEGHGVSPSHVSYTASVEMPISSKLRLIRTKEEDIPSGVWPVFRLMVSTNTLSVGASI